MERRERERILAEGGVRPAGPRELAAERRLDEDLDGSPVRGRPLRRRLRNFRPDVDTYVVSLGGPRPYMQRLREIEAQVERHTQRLAAAWAELASTCDGDSAAFARRWRETAATWRFDDVNDLIDRHNRYYPAESRLPMDPRTGDFVLVDGRRYERQPLDPGWILARFPTRRELAV